ncbi:hypothetical protein Tco_1325814 [Tanacetum coccineum]
MDGRRRACILRDEEIDYRAAITNHSDAKGDTLYIPCYIQRHDSTQDEGASAEGKGRLKAGGMPIKWRVRGKQ